METLFHRYRNVTVLLLVLVGQFLLLAYQVKSQQDVRLIRVWAVTGVMPFARLIEAVRGGTFGFLRKYATLVDAAEENRMLRKELGQLKMENQFLTSQLGTAERAKALAAFQERSPSQTVAARIIGTGTGVNSKVVYVDRGSSSGVRMGMAVVTPYGIVGRVISVLSPGFSQVLQITDPTFRAGVISQRGRLHGTLRGQGQPMVKIDYIQNEDTVADGEWFFTSGDDRHFPKGMPVGQVKRSKPGQIFKDVDLVPSGMQQGLEEVLIVLQGVHEMIPDVPGPPQTMHLLPPPPAESTEEPNVNRSVPGTEADDLVEKYRRKLGGPVPDKPKETSATAPEQKGPAVRPPAAGRAQ